MIGIIDYGSGNIFAIANIYHRLGIRHAIVKDPAEFEKYDKLILPGVGAFDETMASIEKLGMREVLNDLVLRKGKPILGVCVGMQILGEESDEGELPGLGWIKGSVRKIDKTLLKKKPYTPHMGWNSVKASGERELFEGIDQERGFYFLHSYYFDCRNVEDVAAATSYGAEFASSVQHKNVFGVQFHPEKSHGNGVKLFENYARM